MENEKSTAAGRITLVYIFHVAIVIFGMMAPLAVSRSRLSFTHTWFDGLIQWDSQWFATIATYGYKFPIAVQQHFINRGNAVPFHPVYRTAAFLPGLPILIHVVTPIGALIVIEILFFISLSLMYRLIANTYPRLALSAIVLFAVNPCAVYFSALYTETLTLFGMILIVTGLKNARSAGSFYLSLIGVFISTSVHDLGIFSLVYTIRFIRLELYRKATVFFVVGLIPPMLYELYLITKFHTPFALLGAEATWNRQWRWPFTNVFDSLTNTSQPLNGIFVLVMSLMAIAQIAFLFKQDASLRPTEETNSLFSMETGLWMATILLLSLCAYIPGTPIKSVLRFLCMLWPACIPTYWRHAKSQSLAMRMNVMIGLFAAYATWGAAFFTHGWFFQ